MTIAALFPTDANSSIYLPEPNDNPLIKFNLEKWT